MSTATTLSGKSFTKRYESLVIAAFLIASIPSSAPNFQRAHGAQIPDFTSTNFTIRFMRGCIRKIKNSKMGVFCYDLLTTLPTIQSNEI